MKAVLFYSWQSDLPNRENRGLIGNSLEKATKNILDNNPHVTEIEVVMDSRSEAGTPDLVSSIFSKIDNCDIFIADISLINPNSKERLTPNPNVLIELGYASRVLGWEKIICLFNSKYGVVENLPFDIRFRKPIIYNSDGELALTKKQVTKSLTKSVEDIINARLLDKKEYLVTKRTIDLHIQSILFDFCNLLFETGKNNVEKFNYPKLLHSTNMEIKSFLSEKEFLGFHLYKNVAIHINELIDFFNDNLETFFLSEKEHKLLAKIVFALREYKKLIYLDDTFNNLEKDTVFTVQSGHKINPSNPPGSYLLLQPLKDNKAVVISGGDFEDEVVNKLLFTFKVNVRHLDHLSVSISEIVTLVNNWIEVTGNYFIFNPKLINAK